MGRDDEIAAMQKMARQLAGQGASFIDDRNDAGRTSLCATSQSSWTNRTFKLELKDIADRSGHRGEKPHRKHRASPTLLGINAIHQGPK